MTPRIAPIELLLNTPRIMHPDLCVETPSHLDVLLSGFRDYQLNERGLARTSVLDARRLVQNFLEQQVPGGVSGGMARASQ